MNQDKTFINKTQIIGFLIAIISLFLGLFWEKSFKYNGIFDFLIGFIGAIGISLVFKILPTKRKKVNTNYKINRKLF